MYYYVLVATIIYQPEVTIQQKIILYPFGPWSLFVTEKKEYQVISLGFITHNIILQTAFTKQDWQCFFPSSSGAFS